LHVTLKENSVVLEHRTPFFLVNSREIKEYLLENNDFNLKRNLTNSNILFRNQENVLNGFKPKKKKIKYIKISDDLIKFESIKLSSYISHSDENASFRNDLNCSEILIQSDPQFLEKEKEKNGNNEEIIEENSFNYEKDPFANIHILFKNPLLDHGKFSALSKTIITESPNSNKNDFSFGNINSNTNCTYIFETEDKYFP
jgi:hypothetical protein